MFLSPRFARCGVFQERAPKNAGKSWSGSQEDSRGVEGEEPPQLLQGPVVLLAFLLAISWVPWISLL